MIITEMIKKLESLKEKHGNIKIFVDDVSYAGDYGYSYTFRIITDIIYTDDMCDLNAKREFGILIKCE